MAVDSTDPFRDVSHPQVLLVVSTPWVGVARIPRLLREAGAHVVLLCRRGRFAARSRYVDEHIEAPGEPAAMLPVLQELLAERSFSWVVLGDDPIMRVAIANRGPWQRPWFPVDPESDLPLMLVSKTAFAWFMERAGLPIPPTEVASREEVQAAARRVGFPVMIKADQGSSGTGVFHVSNEASLAGFRFDDPVVVQRFIPGKVGSTVVLFSRGNPLCWMCSYKEEVYPRPFGPSTVRRYVHLPGHPELLEQLGAATGITGLIGIDWLQPESGEPLLLELNPRPTPWAHLYGRYGVDLPAAIHGMLYGMPHVFPPPEAVMEPLVRLFPQDAYRAASDRDWRAFVPAFMDADDAPRDDPSLHRAYRGYLVKRAWECWRRKAA